MSKSARKDRHPVDTRKRRVTSGKHLTPHPHKSALSETSKLNKRIITYIIIAILAIIPFGLGKYCEFNSPGAFDSGGYVYSAKHVLEGAQLGVEEKPSAQMGTLLINMLGVRLFGFSDTGPKILQMILQAGALLVMFITMMQLFGLLPAAFGVVIASIYLSAPLIAKYGNVKEQYMIAFMILGICCYVLGQLKGKWWYLILAGAFLGWGPLFKETGTSAVGAVGLFVIAQPLLKHRSWKQTGCDIILLLAGVLISVGPIYIWLAKVDATAQYWPYAKLWRLFFPGEGPRVSTYISKSRQMMSFTELAPRIFRYYKLLILPIALAISSIILKVFRMFSVRLSKSKSAAETIYDRFVLLFAVWWILDISFIWISPRSYEQYYLPLNASAAMLGGYMISAYREKLKSNTYKSLWILAGFVGFVLMIAMSWHMFFGIGKSPHSGAIYTDSTGAPEKRNGYRQRLAEASSHRKGARGYWELIGEYMQNNSTPDDCIYVWGWYPGIYVAAQRLSPAPKAFEGTMHTLTPEALSERVDEILNAFEQKQPKFIADSRKSHFPWDRPPLELWPTTSQGFLPADQSIIEVFDQEYARMLDEQIEPDEALRYKAMKPFREYVMQNYTVVQAYGQHVLFQRK
ncbi:ArnT family glycosyltransferase [Planctomycetota bacterium]